MGFAGKLIITSLSAKQENVGGSMISLQELVVRLIVISLGLLIYNEFFGSVEEKFLAFTIGFIGYTSQFFIQKMKVYPLHFLEFIFLITFALYDLLIGVNSKTMFFFFGYFVTRAVFRIIICVNKREE